MYGYAASSAAASTLAPFTPPKSTTNPAGLTGQSAAVAQAAGASAGSHTQTRSLSCRYRKRCRDSHSRRNRCRRRQVSRN